MIPTRKQCLELIERYQMLTHIVRHSKRVTEVALLIGRKLNQSGHHLDLTLIEAASLLHDITKTKSLETRENHARTGAELLTSLGYPAVANIVCQHICLDSVSSEQDAVSEAELVNYSDKRVKHEEVVDIEERFKDVQERYAKNFPELQARIQEVQLEARLLEKKIFSKIDISPEELGDILANTYRV